MAAALLQQLCLHHFSPQLTRSPHHVSLSNQSYLTTTSDVYCVLTGTTPTPFVFNSTQLESNLLHVRPLHNATQTLRNALLQQSAAPQFDCMLH
jgi:hypothetical protein